MIFCPSCKSTLLTGTIFCDACGGFIDQTSHPEEGKRGYCLVLKHSNSKIDLGDAEKVLLGREPVAKNDEKVITLEHLGALEHGVSRNHCFINQHESKFFVRDLGSMNGTWHNLVRIIDDEPVLLHNGDDLRLGSLEFKVIIK